MGEIGHRYGGAAQQRLGGRQRLVVGDLAASAGQDAEMEIGDRIQHGLPGQAFAQESRRVGRAVRIGGAARFPRPIAVPPDGLHDPVADDEERPQPELGGQTGRGHRHVGMDGARVRVLGREPGQFAGRRGLVDRSGREGRERPAEHRLELRPQREDMRMQVVDDQNAAGH